MSTVESGTEPDKKLPASPTARITPSVRSWTGDDWDRYHARAEALAWRQTNHPQPWHGPDRDRDPWEPHPLEIDIFER